MPRVIHFEIPADDPKRAAEFYMKVFGWTVEKWGEMEYWLAVTGKEGEPGIDGAITTRMTMIVEIPFLLSFPMIWSQNS